MHLYWIGIQLNLGYFQQKNSFPVLLMSLHISTISGKWKAIDGV